MIEQKEMTRLKGRLTRAERSGDPEKVLNEARYGLARFEEVGYPDQWHRWRQAEDDALLAIRQKELPW